MVLTKLIHGIIFAEGLAIAVATGAGIQAHNKSPRLSSPEGEVELALYTAEVFSTACSVYGGFFLIYDIRGDRKRRRE